ncbi:MAG: UDP-N-acetylmuramoyl-tripeptide--D-alanyl-D-alanine ligase [Candidatus Symbiothrix sp.]|jgi:UDP-N-acetylmuramoyl-tripeptide--D-alanyl-D-alanine ligase|nr:UDP-N-acetylmuramoyl-tripeptide--D-alanyl-D-alanine ligase [Candidatus Symbiothrix sp.]
MNLDELYSIFLHGTTITTDSRICPEGSIFFALKGDHFDGNDYIGQALKAGAGFAVGDRQDLPSDKRIIRVEDALQTLQDLANYHRNKLKTTVIAITGTNGKTSTKELVAATLSAQYNILFTSGNLNNHIGVPLTLLQLKPEHQFAVVEMGANHPGEIKALCRIAAPDYGLITNVGKAHLEGFGSFEGVIQAKTELYDFLRDRGGTVFGNFNNLYLKDFYTSLHMVYYGNTSEAFVSGRITTTEPCLELEWTKDKEKTPTHYCRTNLVGGYNFENVMAAVCIASYFGVESEKISRAIAAYVPQNNRSQNLQTTKNRLIIDAYNANPSSMKAALDNFLALHVSPKMVILGEMKELGAYSKEEHQQLIDRLSASGLDKVFLCGESFVACCSIPSDWRIFPQTTDLLTYLPTADISGYYILIKGSRTNQLEKTTAFL